MSPAEFARLAQESNDEARRSGALALLAMLLVVWFALLVSLS